MYAAVQMFIDTHMIGVGLRGYAESILNFYSYQELIGIVLPHNVTYTILAELGLIGIMLFLFIIYRLTRDSYLNIRYASDELSRVVATSLFVSLMAFFMFFQFIGGGLPDNNVWLIIGLVYATKHTLLSRAQDA
jgi:O-antigen ligase